MLAVAVMLTGILPTPARAADPACPSMLAALDQAQQTYNEAIPIYNAETPEQRAQEDAELRRTLAGFRQGVPPGVSSTSAAAQINDNIRAATGRSMMELFTSVRTVPDVPRVLGIFRSAVTRYCNAPVLSEEQAARADLGYRIDKRSADFVVEQAGAQTALEAAERKRAAFEEALQRADLGKIVADLKEQQKEVRQDMLKVGLEGAASAALEVVGALGKGGELLKDALSHSKDWTTGLLGTAQFAQALTSGKPLTRSDWENIGKGVIDLTSGTATAIGLVAAGSAAAATAAVASGTILVGGTVSSIIEAGLLSLRGNAIAIALRRTTERTAANRALLIEQVEAAEQRLQYLKGRRARLEHIRTRLAAGS